MVESTQTLEFCTEYLVKHRGKETEKKIVELHAEFNKISQSVRVAGQIAFEHIVMIAHTAQKNHAYKEFFITQLTGIVSQWAKVSDELKKKTKQYYEIWAIYHKIHILRELARNLFYGSVFSDILDRNTYAKLLIEAGKSLTSKLNVGPDVWNELKGKIED